MRKDPLRRPTATQATRHAWLQEAAVEMAEALPSPALIGAIMLDNASRRPGKRASQLKDVAAMTDLARVRKHAKRMLQYVVREERALIDLPSTSYLQL